MNLSSFPFQKSLLFSIVFLFMIVSNVMTPLQAQCPCSGRMTSVSFKYDSAATPGITFNVYQDHTQSQLIHSFSNVQPGDVLTVESSMVGLDRFDNRIYVEVAGSPCPSQVQTSCYVDIIGEKPTGVFTVVAYEDYQGRSCYLPSTIGNRVFEDSNANGLQDAGELGIDGITVILYDEIGVPEDFDITTNGGLFEFTNLAPGNYQLGFGDLPDGYVNTLANIGLNDSIDSDVDQNSNLTDLISLDPNEIDNSWDLGIVLASSFPVEFLDIEVEFAGEVAELRWRTAMELNNDRFEIERSLGQGEFVHIGTVGGVGTSSDIQSYLFQDDQVYHQGHSLASYRIRQVDVDGHFEYSNVVILSLGEVNSDLFKTYPNPTVDIIHVETVRSHAELLLMNTSGSVIQRFLIPEHTGLHILDIDLSALPRGTYLLRLSDETSVHIQKIIKS